LLEHQRKLVRSLTVSQASRSPLRTVDAVTLEAAGSVESPERSNSAAPHHDPRFATTHWSCVLAAGATDTQEVRTALSRLLETYWYPLNAFVRRKGRDPEEAFDLTQEFLTCLLERNMLSAADPAKGRFRTFLLTALERFLVDEWRREGRKKRGGGRTPLSLSAFERRGKVPARAGSYSHRGTDL